MSFVLPELLADGSVSGDGGDGDSEVAQRLVQIGFRVETRRTVLAAFMLERSRACNWPNGSWAFRRLFRTACAGGHLALARKLHSSGFVDIHDCDEAFLGAMANPSAHHVARWLLSQHPGCWDAFLRVLRTWSGPRDAWMRSVVRCVPM
jgi:hypothetical protein